MAAGVKGTKGIVRNHSWPPEIWARLERAAKDRYAAPTSFVVRFVIENIDVIDPPGDA